MRVPAGVERASKRLTRRVLEWLRPWIQNQRARPANWRLRRVKIRLMSAVDCAKL